MLNNIRISHPNLNEKFRAYRPGKRHIGVVVRMSILDTKVDDSIPSINMFSP